MRVLIVHNAYQHRGGEDAVVENETASLKRAGCEVETFSVSNQQIGSTWRKVRTWLDVSSGGARMADAATRVRQVRPDIVHVHNYFPLLSPAVHAVVRQWGAATVQTFHNFRFACAGAIMQRNNQPCDLCLSKSPYNAVVHACYKNSRLGTLAVARSISEHRRQKTWVDQVDRIIALTDFSRGMMIRAGLPSGKIVVKPNGLRDPGSPEDGPRRGLLYVGRLSDEKGVRVLAEAARMSGCDLTVVGDGPLAGSLAGVPNIKLAGWLSPQDVRVAMTGSVAVVVPSICFESLPMAIVEAFSTGTPVIASRIGALADLVDHRVDALHVEPGDPQGLAASMLEMLREPAAAARMGAAARRKYERQWTEAVTTRALLKIYEDARAARDFALAG